MIGKRKYEKIKEIERISTCIIIMKKNIILLMKDWSTCTCNIEICRINTCIVEMCTEFNFLYIHKLDITNCSTIQNW